MYILWNLNRIRYAEIYQDIKAMAAEYNWKLMKLQKAKLEMCLFRSQVH